MRTINWTSVFTAIASSALTAAAAGAFGTKAAAAAGVIGIVVQSQMHKVAPSAAPNAAG